MPKDLHSLPKLRDSLSFIYFDKAVIEQEDSAVVAVKGSARIPIPIAAMTVLMLGPGVSITHAAIKNITDCGCVVVWCGEDGAKFYCFGHGETKSSANLLHQAKMCMDEKEHIQVVYRMYSIRFPDMHTEGMSLQQVRGLEGIRVREAYRRASQITGVKWNKRDYSTDDWDESDPINKAISYANTILYAICEGAILSLGFSTGIGFIHTGKMLSFVYDIADIYKATTTIPAAFESVASGNNDLMASVRINCRKYMVSEKILSRLPKDIAFVLGMKNKETDSGAESIGNLWDKDRGPIEGGKNYSFSQET